MIQISFSNGLNIPLRNNRSGNTLFNLVFIGNCSRGSSWQWYQGVTNTMNELLSYEMFLEYKCSSLEFFKSRKIISLKLFFWTWKILMKLNLFFFLLPFIVQCDIKALPDWSNYLPPYRTCLCMDMHPENLTSWVPWDFVRSARGYFQSTYELLNLTALKFQCCIKIASFNVWVRYFEWNFEGNLGNSTQNILSIHWRMCILFRC